MKWTLMAAVGLLGVATATPAPKATCVPSGGSTTCPTKTFNVVANFDDLADGYKLKQPYDLLTYSNLTVSIRGGGAHARGVIPNTKPNYAIAGPYPSPYTTAPKISITGTKTTSFDFQSFWAGCLVATPSDSGYAATNCQFTVDCLNAGDSRHQGPFLYTYTPSSATAAPMTPFSPDFIYCKQADFSVYTSGPGPANTLFVIDSVKYTAREGEVFQ